MRSLFLIGLLCLTGCGTVQQTTFSTVGNEITPMPSPTAAGASGIERLCEAFDIVTGTISPAYESIASNTSSLNVQAQALEIMLAGSDIADLAEGVTEPEFSEILTTMGEGYIAEGEAVSEGDLGSTDATSYYLDQVVEYGQQCP